MKKAKYVLLTVVLVLLGVNNSYCKADFLVNLERPRYTPTVDSLLSLIEHASSAELMKHYPRLHKALYEVGDIDIHLKYNHYFVEAAKAAENKKAEAIAYTLQIEALYNYRMPDSILLAESLKALDFMRDITGVAVHYFFVASVVGDVYMLKGNYEEALNIAGKFYREANKMNNSSGIVTSLQTMGKAYEELGLLKQAEASFRESIIAADEKTDTGLKGESYSFLVDMLNDQKLNDEALKINNEFEAYLERIDAYNGELKNLCFLNALGYAATYTQKGQYHLAAEYIKKAEEIPVSQTDMGRYTVEKERYRLLLEEGKYAEAEQSLNKLEHLLRDDSASSYKASGKIKDARSELYYRWGKFEKAANAYKDNIIRKDSLQRVEMATKLNTLRTQYEVNKLEMQKEQQKSTFRTTLIWLTLALILLLAIIIIVLINTRILRDKNHSLLYRIRELDKLEQENEQMRNQLVQNDIGISVDDKEDENLEHLYLRLKQLMKDTTIFTDPNVNRKTIAEKLGTNEKYVFDTIKKYYGTNISDYINCLRLNYVRALLTLPSETRTVNDIALDAGFNSRSVFYRLFKEHYGMTPAEFRQLVGHS